MSKVDKSSEADVSESENAEEEEYEPDMDNLVIERVENYLEGLDEMCRAYEIASAIESKPGYTRTKCNELHEQDVVEKEKRGNIIGHPMPPNGDDLRVLESDREGLLQIVKKYGTPGQYQQALKITTIEELREFIEEKIAIGDGYPLGTQKAFFGIVKEDQ